MFATLVVIGFFLGGCSGGGSSSGASVGDIIDDGSEVTTYTVTAFVSGEGGTVTPENQNVSGGDFATVTVTPATGFVIAGVTTDCGGGTLSGDTYTTIAITANCSIEASFEVSFEPVYAVGVGVSGLAEEGEVRLQLSGGVISEEISVPNGDFFFLTPVVNGDYAVTVLEQPQGWVCTVTPTTVTVVDADAAVAVGCVRPIVDDSDDGSEVTTYTVTASVSRGSGTVTPESQSVNAGGFAAVTVTPATGFVVADVTTDCGGGTLSGDTYTTVAVTADCSIQATFEAVYAVGVDVSGLPEGDEVTLQVSGDGVSEEINVPNGEFAFAPVVSGDYAVSVIAQPEGWECTVDPATVTVAGADAAVAVGCVRQYAVVGTVSGLPEGGEVSLQLSGGVVAEERSVSNGDFAFATPVVNGNYTVTVLVQPEGWVCTVTPATVTVVDADATVAVDCVRQLVLNYGIKQLQFSWVGVADAHYYRLYEDADGDGPGAEVVIAEVADPVVTRDIALYEQSLNARYQVSACVDINATPTDTTDDDCNAVTTTVGLADNLIPAIGYVKGAGPVTAGGLFGGAAALSEDGSTLAVGVPGAAAVYVYSRDEAGTWSRQEHAFEGGANSAFGASLALSATGDVLAVGAPDEAGEGDVSGAGSVYIYAFDGADWSGPERLVLTAPATGDGFGSAVVLSADGLNLAVGAPGVDAAAGAVYLYTFGTTWGEGKDFRRTMPVAGDRFGSAVALNDNGRVLAAGAPGGNGVDLFEMGARKTWDPPISYSGMDADGKFGSTLALAPDGRTLVVGAPDEDVVFTGEGGDVTVSAAGSVYVIAKSGKDWTTPVRITRPNPVENEHFGAAVAYGDGTLPTLAVGAPGEDGSGARGIDGVGAEGVSSSGSGAVYLYTLDGSWGQQAYVKAANPDAGDGFGSAVALASDGNTLAVGAPGEDSVFGALCALGMDSEDVAACANAQADAGAPDAGAVYLY